MAHAYPTKGSDGHVTPPRRPPPKGRTPWARSGGPVGWLGGASKGTPLRTSTPTLPKKWQSPSEDS